MKYQDFAFTLRKVSVKKTPPTFSTYDDHIDKIFKQKGLNVIDYGFEHEGGLHCHGIVELKDKYIYKHTQFRVRGWKVHLVPLYDQQGWINYYNKANKKDHVKIRYYEPTQEDLEESHKFIKDMQDEINHLLFKKVDQQEDENSKNKDELCLEDLIDQDDQWDDDNIKIPKKRLF